MEKRAAQIFVILLSHIYFLLLCMTSIVVDGMPRRNGASSRNSAIHSIQTMHTAKLQGWLQSKKGLFVEILDNGTVQGTYNKSSLYTIVELRSYNTSLKRIYGVESGRFVAMKRSGRVHGTKKVKNNSLLIEHLELNSYITYRFSNQFKPNDSHQGFFAIKENGHVRRGDTTRLGMDSTQFLFLHS